VHIGHDDVAIDVMSCLKLAAISKSYEFGGIESQPCKIPVRDIWFRKFH
jgi:hypothetical protein